MKWLTVFAACVVSGVWVIALVPPREDEAAVREQPCCIDVSRFFDAAGMQSVRRDPRRADALFERFRRDADFDEPEWLAELSESEQLAVFCCLLSYASAPYGESLALTFEGLLREPRLDCDNYALLTKYYFDLLRRLRGLPESKFELVGWHGDAFGNHALLFVRGKKHTLLLDPTIAVVAVCDFDGMAAGRPVNAARIVDFSWRTRLQQFRGRVIAAVRDGKCRPSHLLYYFADLDRYAKNPGASDLLNTPGAVRMREEARRAKARAFHVKRRATSSRSRRDESRR